MPLCVGVKNGFVVTWLTTTKWYFGLGPKIEAAAPVPPLLVLDAVAVPVPVFGVLWLEPPHACSAIAAMPAAPPVSAVRRVTCFMRLAGLSGSLRSSHSSRSTTSPMKSSSDMHCSSLCAGRRPKDVGVDCLIALHSERIAPRTVSVTLLATWCAAAC